MIRDTLLLGAATGLGVALTIYGLRPPRPGLSRVLHELDHPSPPPPPAGRRRERLLAAPMTRLGLPRPALRRDLALLDHDPTTFLAEQAAALLLGALVAPILALWWRTGGMSPLWLSALGAAAGYHWAQAAPRRRAARRRAQLRHTLSTMLDLVTISLAGGAGVEQALDDAASVCRGWAADRLRASLDSARLLRQPIWQPLGELGADTGTPELVDLAATMRLAGAEGARVRASLAARAAGLRARSTAEMETAARSTGVRMSLPVLLLALGYGLFLLYPALATIRSGL